LIAKGTSNAMTTMTTMYVKASTSRVRTFVVRS